MKTRGFFFQCCADLIAFFTVKVQKCFTASSEEFFLLELNPTRNRMEEYGGGWRGEAAQDQQENLCRATQSSAAYT